MDIGEMQRKLSVWAERRLTEPDKGLFASRKDLRLFDLYHLLYGKDWLHLAYERVAQNSGSRTAGCDGLNMAGFKRNLENNLQKIADDLKTQTFRPHPVRRVYIPKKDGKMRPLGIPTVRDRIVQEALRMVLEPIFEAEFYRNSYGFRPNRSTVDALAMISAMATSGHKYFWVIEGDIKSYFDTINHQILLRLLRRRIRDKKLLRLIWRYLKAGVMEDGLFARTETGAPQGGIVSPLLANVYLHELDMFMAQLADLPTNLRERRRSRGRPNFVHIRYADDFVVMCNGTKADAEAMRARIQEFLASDLKLTLSMEKTKVTHVEDGFVFLGYEVHRQRSRRGHRVTKFLIPRDAQRKLRATIQRITTYSASYHSINAKLIALNRHLTGWANYYRHAHNRSIVFSNLDYFAFWRMAHWLGRKYRCSLPNVMRRFKRRVDRRMTLATEHAALSQMSRIGHRMLRLRTFHNPYTTKEGLLLRVDSFGTERIWYGVENRPGMADLRCQVMALDHWKCQSCGTAVDLRSANVDHVRPLRRFKRPAEANRLDNLQTLCLNCHIAKTTSERQLESRMR